MLALLLAATVSVAQAPPPSPVATPIDRYRDCIKLQVRQLASGAQPVDAGARMAIDRCSGLRDPAIAFMVERSADDARLRGDLSAAGRSPADLRTAWAGALDDGMAKAAAEGIRRLRAGLPLEGTTATGTYSGGGKVGEPLRPAPR